MAFNQSVTLSQIVGFGPFGKILATVQTRLAAVIALNLEMVDNTPDEFKPISKPTQDALDVINDDIATLNGGQTTLDNRVTAVENELVTVNADIDTLTSGQSTLDTRVTALETDESDLDARVTTLEAEIIPHTYPTASRPDPTTVAMGTMIYDTDLTMPLWSDTVNWKDAAGGIQ